MLGRSRGSGRGRGRGRTTEQEDVGIGSTPLTRVVSSRGRGRREQQRETFPTSPEDEVRPLPGSSAGSFLRPDDSSSDEDENFIAAFRRSHPFAGVREPSPLQLTPSSSQESLQGRGWGTGAGLFGPSDSSGSSSPAPLVGSLGFTSSGSGNGGSDRSTRGVSAKGAQGQEVSLCVNYVRLKFLKDAAGLFEYHVDFDPHIGSKHLRKKVIYEADLQLGSIKGFDGAKLYLPLKLGQQTTVFSASHPVHQNECVQVKVMFVKQNDIHGDCHFYNILLRRVMDKLGLLEMRRNYFDYRRVIEIPEHKLDIWPGFVTAINNYEDGLMLCCDSTFRVLRTETMLDVLLRMYYFSEQDQRFDWRNAFRDYALGKIVLTRYNNKHYRVDDIDWERNPNSTFPMTRKGQLTEVSFIDYYRGHYNISITDLVQPMLVSRGKIMRLQGSHSKPPENIFLVPELCYVTGISEDMVQDVRLMKAVTEKTRIAPAQRVVALHDFIRAVNGSREVKKIFEDWGLLLDDAYVKLNGRILGAPKIILGQNEAVDPKHGEFGKSLLKNQILEPVAVSDWIVICHNIDEPKAVRAIANYKAVAPPLGIPCRGDPKIIRVKGHTPSDLRQALENSVIEGRTQFVMVIIPSNRDDLYRITKVFCNHVRPVASQVIRSKTLSDERKIRSVMQKVALQVNCKLGGALWTIKIPLPEKIMFMGMDVYHDPRRKVPSITAMVASINLYYTKYYTRIVSQESQQENISGLRPILVEALQAFYNECSGFPDRIIMFRDGVGDSQLDLTKELEVSQMLSAFEMLNFQPNFTFCVVQKRINTRLFLRGQHNTIDNPRPGTVLDHTITRPCLFDFFLVSQLIREGTVNPTHYIAIYDNSSMKPDVLQKFAYACSYMYYNWSGSIRVPAMCQYAHKAAGLVGQHMRREPSSKLADKLYYL